jgi:hypothetical protein
METLIYADSRNRDSNLYPSGNSYTLHLTNPLKGVTQVDLVSAEFPNTFYNLLDGRSCLNFNGTDFHLNPGYYTAGCLATEINSRLPLSQFGQVTYQYSNVNWISTQGKYVFLSGTTFTLTVSNSISKLIGLPAGTYTSNSTSTDSVLNQTYGGSAWFIKSQKVADFSTNEYIFLDIEELRTPTTSEALAMKPDGSGTFSGANARNSFAMIPVNVNSGVVKSFNEGSDFGIKIEYPHPIDVISRLTIRWVDASGQLVNFNGMENNAALLRFHQEKKEPPPPPPEIDKVELRRILDEMITVQKPQKVEEKRPLVGRWTLIILLILGAIIYYYTKRIRAVAPVARPLPPQV